MNDFWVGLGEMQRHKAAEGTSSHAHSSATLWGKPGWLLYSPKPIWAHPAPLPLCPRLRGAPWGALRSPVGSNVRSVRGALREPCRSTEGSTAGTPRAALSEQCPSPLGSPEGLCVTPEGNPVGALWDSVDSPAGNSLWSEGNPLRH